MLSYVKKRKEIHQDEEEEESIQEAQATVSLSPTLDEALHGLNTLKMYMLAQPNPSEELMQGMINMNSVFLREMHKGKKLKQCKIYDFLSNKL